MSGTKITRARELPLTVAEVLSILRGSAQANVTHLTFRGLEIDFSPGPGFLNSQYSVSAASAVATAERIDHTTTEQEEFITRDLQVDELVLTDPVLYEDMLDSGELEDGSTPVDDSRSSTE